MGAASTVSCNHAVSVNVPSLSLPQMQSLTSCQCSVCCDCFQQHFTIVVRDKHIRDMVCPVCWEPDINDPEHLNSYFSTLDIQVRESCLVESMF